MSDMTESASALDPRDVAAHAERVRALARRLVKDGGLAEDVAQETWLVALRRPRRDDVPLSWWLSGVVRNVVRHARRDDATRRRRELESPQRRDVDAPDALVERTEIHHRLVGAVLALEEPYRATILMRYFEDLSAAEIARRVGVPGATVRSRLKRGLDMLRARLDADERGDRRKWALVLAPFAWTGKTRSGASVLAAAAACLLLVAAATAVTRPWRRFGGSDTDGTSGLAVDGDAVSPAGAKSHGVASSATRRSPDAAADVATARAHPDSQKTGASDAAVDAAATPETAALSIEVVDEAGVRAPATGVTIKLDIRLMVLSRPNTNYDVIEPGTRLLNQLRGANPFVTSDVPKELYDAPVPIYACVPGFPPTASATFTAHVGKTEQVKLVAAKAQSASVLVVDRTTDSPISNASVVSTTELERRGIDTKEARGKTGPGAAVTVLDGRCTLGDLGRGDHEIEVDAAGYSRAKLTWSDGQARVRLEPRRGNGTATVVVVGRDDLPVAGIDVTLSGTDRVVRTDASGIAVFEDVSAGSARFALEGRTWFDVCTDRGWKFDIDAMVQDRSVDVPPGGKCRTTLGFMRRTAGLDCLVVDDEGAPLEGVSIELLHAEAALETVARTDSSGNARFSTLPAGEAMLALSDPDGLHTRWIVGFVGLLDGERVTRTWTLGRNAIRGRVVTGPDRRAVAGARVSAKLSPTLIGVATTDADGRFEFCRATGGTYLLSVSTDHGGARVAGAAVPSDAEFVLNLAPYGRVAVRFLPADRPQLIRSKVRVVDAALESDRSINDGQGDDDLVASDLVAGRYVVEVTLDGKKRAFPVDVKSGETSVVVVSAP
jgi:RNA polymerase sigma-70 factor (ECF subfamily)